MAFSNTVTLSTDLNVDPYYDDFDESKNYHRVLFRPGLAVQARELTQLQTMLQNQIDRFGEHIFQEGSVVAGAETIYDNNYTFVKIRDNDLNGDTVTANSFIGQTIYGATSNLYAVVVNSVDGAEASTPDLKTLYIKYISTGANTAGNTVFTLGERLIAQTQPSLSANVASGTGSAGAGSLVTINEGIVFVKDHFVRIPAQSIVIGKYSANASYTVGYNLIESVVNSDTDSTLLDPAQGAYNYAAPGADRLKLTPTIAKYALNNISSTNFIELIQIKNGVVQERFDRPQYSDIRDYLAKRTYDINGNFHVEGMAVRLREHLRQNGNKGVFTGGSADKLTVDIEPGLSYVSGYDIRTIVTKRVAMFKATDYESVEQVQISANYGNYVNVNQVAGVWDVNTHNKVNLYDSFAQAVSNTQYSSAAAAGNLAGTARARAIEYTSGTKGAADAQYKLYLYDVQMTGNTFSNVKSIRIDNSLSSVANGIADIVVSASNTAVLNETDFNRSIFKIPANAIRTIRDTTGNIDTNFQFLKSFNVTIGTDGTFTLLTGAADETYPFSAGALNTTQKQTGFHVVLNEVANSASSIATGTITSGANSVTGVTDADTKLNVGDIVKFGSYANTFTVSSVGATSFTTLEPALATLTSNTITKEFRPGQVIDLSGYGGDKSQRSVVVDSSTQASFDIQETLNNTVSATVITELNKVDGQEKAKLYRSNRYVQITVDQSNGSANTTGPWNLGFADVHKITDVRRKTGNSVFTAVTEGSNVTSYFTLDSGQKDNFYDHGKLKLKAGTGFTPSASDVYLVKLNYFAESTSQGKGYFSVDSYPIDDSNAANTTAITTQEIPIYVSPVSGRTFNLRDSIDIRPRVSDTSADATTVGSASVNPGTSTTLVSSAGGLRFMAPNENMTMDLDYYLARKDVVSLSPEGEFMITTGRPSLNPVAPQHPQENLIFARITIPPYPSLSPDSGRIYQRPDLTSRIEPVRIEGYTMKEIGDLEKRIDRLEYYTKLSILEMEATNLQFADANGQDRFKNGVIVDTFRGHNIGNVYNEDYKVSIDPVKGELRPTFRLNNVDLDYQSANSFGVQLGPKDARLTVGGTDTFTVGETITAGSATGTLVYQVGRRLYLENVSDTAFSVGITASGGSSSSSGVISAVSTPGQGKLLSKPYEHFQLITQPNAAVTRNAAGLFWNFVGKVTLNPETDYWVDTVTAPDVQANFEGNLDNWQQLANAWGTQWGDWQTVWSGYTDDQTVETETYWETTEDTTDITVRAEFIKTVTPGTTTISEREGKRLIVTPATVTQSLGDRVVDVNLIPFMRSRVIEVTGEGFKPNTTLYAFFDSTGVGSYITPTDSSFTPTNNEGTRLSSDENGNVYCLFRIPNDNDFRFRVGEKKFRLTDSSTNAVEKGLVTTSGEAIYTAKGSTITKQQAVVSTRVPQVSYESLTEVTTLTTEGGTKVEPTGRTETSIHTSSTGSYNEEEDYVVDNGDNSRYDYYWDRLGRKYTFNAIAATVDGIPSSADENNGIYFAPRPEQQQALFDQVQERLSDPELCPYQDPIAQTFLINEQQSSTPGVYLTKIDLYFATKDTTRDVFVEIREVDPSTNVITNNIIPFSNITLRADDINTSTDASAATPVHFPTPIYLKNKYAYAVVIKPAGNNPNVSMWVSKLGQNDVITGNRISKQPYAGVLFASSNNRTWTPVQDEDLKFNLYIADFFDEFNSNVVFKQKDYEFFKINGSNTFNTVNEVVHGETTLSASAIANTQSLIGLYATGATTGATGIITDVTGTDIKVKDVSLASKFSTSDFVNFRTGNTTGTIIGNTTGVLTSTSTPTGYVDFFDSTTDLGNTYLTLINTNGTFTIGEQLKGQTNGRTATINSIDKLEVDLINLNADIIEHDLTAIVAQSRFNTSLTLRDTVARNTEVNLPTEFNSPKYILSKSLENANSGEKSAEITFGLYTGYPRISPVIDTERVNATIVDNNVNNDSTGENNSSGGNALARYISRTMTLADGQDAEDLVVKFRAYKPVETDIEVYFKVLNNEDSDEFSERDWVQMDQSTLSSIISSSENREDFQDYEFTVPTSNLTGPSNELQYTNSQGVTYTGFKYMAVKLVLLSSSEVIVPRVRNLIVVALQI